jgi:hypothetical protein
MRLPTRRLTITPSEYRLLKPGLDVLANGLADTKAGHFPNRHPWHLIDWVASGVYRDQAYDDEMAARIIRVRRILWDLTQSRKIHLDGFELSALALALRLARAQKLVDTTESISAEIELLQFKIETYRKRAKRSATARVGATEYQSAAGRWRRFAAWLRYNVLYVNFPKRGEPRPATLWREQRRQLTELINKALAERFFESPCDVEMVKIVTLAARSLRRGRHSVGLRELLRAPRAHTDFLVGFVEKRVELKRLPGAPIPHLLSPLSTVDVVANPPDVRTWLLFENSSFLPLNLSRHGIDPLKSTIANEEQTGTRTGTSTFQVRKSLSDREAWVFRNLFIF